LRRDFPHLEQFLRRLADLDETTVVKEQSDHTVIDLRAPLDRSAIRAHYPSIDRVHAWVEELEVLVADDADRALARIRFDGRARVLHIRAIASEGDLLWSDGEQPIRDQSGNPSYLDFALTDSLELVLHVKVTGSILRIGRLRLFSVRVPPIRLSLRFIGDADALRARWQLRIASIGAPRAPLRWILPLERIFDTVRESFCMHIELAPHPSVAGLHELVIEYQVETVRSALLELAESLFRWGSRSRVFRDLLGLWHDLVVALNNDLDALRR
jgi:hypothetical protein